MTIPALSGAPGNPRRPIPDWLLRRLDAQGLLDLDAGASRTARPARCAGCGAWVIRALDGDVLARAVDADPEPLAAVGEAAALLHRIPTYRLWRLAGRWQLDRRDRWTIRGQVAGALKDSDVLAQHRCRGPRLARAPSNVPEPVSPAQLPDQPPF